MKESITIYVTKDDPQFYQQGRKVAHEGMEWICKSIGTKDDMVWVTIECTEDTTEVVLYFCGFPFIYSVPFKK